jgi:adenine-specific DNA-methyltransferase
MNETTLNGQSADIVSENIQKLKQIFPEVFCEDSIDFEKLQAVLGEHIDDDNERYNFTWWGKSRALRLAQTPSMGTLRPCIEESKDWDTTENLYIEGDNLEVLKLLQKSFHGKVKMIYIDPPYNTGKDFVYPDNYKDPLQHYLEMTGQVNKEGKKISTNSEASGRYHTNWLNMMYPRLRLARNLLRNDGVAFISIDDNEVDNLKKMCNEIFGEDNFICQFVWAAGRKNDSKLVSISHEYVLCYVKNKNFLEEKKILWRERKQGIDDIYKKYKQLKNKYSENYGNIQVELKSWFRSLPKTHPAKNHSHYSSVDKRGIYFPDNISWPGGGGPTYEVLHPTTKKPVRIPSRGWMFSSAQKMEEVIKDDRVHFGKDEKSVPCIKSYLINRETSVPYSVFYKDGRASTKRLRSIFGRDVFENPKDEIIIQSFLEFTSTQESIVVDFFSGSATTAHAVMKINAEDGGKRKFIMVQLPEATDEKSEAYKVGYENICEIGKERIRRAGEKIKADLIDKNNGKLPLDGEKQVDPEALDIGFKVFKLDSSNLRKWNPDVENIEGSLLDAIENYVDGRSALDVVYEIMLKYGIDLTYPIEVFETEGKKIYSVGFGALMICLENEITTDIAHEIARLKEEINPEVMRVVFKDNGFRDDSVKTNTKEILRNAGIDEIVSV